VITGAGGVARTLAPSAWLARLKKSSDPNLERRCCRRKECSRGTSVSGHGASQVLIAERRATGHAIFRIKRIGYCVQRHAAQGERAWLNRSCSCAIVAKGQTNPHTSRATHTRADSAVFRQLSEFPNRLFFHQPDANLRKSGGTVC
jgi:hypothetical protein